MLVQELDECCGGAGCGVRVTGDIEEGEQVPDNNVVKGSECVTFNCWKSVIGSELNRLKGCGQLDYEV